MTNILVGDVYQKIIEEVVLASTNDFEESGVGQATLNELRQAWQAKLSARGVAQMPWDPKPDPTPRYQGNGAAVGHIDERSYRYDDAHAANGVRVKVEPVQDQQYASAQPGNFMPPGPQQGGIARAQELVQERFGQQAAAAIQRPTGLALPGQMPKPQGLQLPNNSLAQQQFMQQQQAAMQAAHAAQTAHGNARIKIEGENLQPGQRMPAPAYAQTDGADEYAEWDAFIAQRRATHAQAVEENDRMMRDQIRSMTAQFDSGLLLPMDEHVSRLDKRKQRQMVPRTTRPGPAIPQLDGDDDDDDKDLGKLDDDDDAINSDLDDPEDEQNAIGDDDDDLGDSILCTYDKVQRVKNKWKCTLKDGVLNTGGKEWLFHKGQGEFEW